MTLFGDVLRATFGAGESRVTAPSTGAMLGAITRALRGGGVAGHLPGVINADTAMRHDAVYACVRTITKPISVAPIRVYAGDEFAAVTEGDRRPVPAVLRSPAADFDIDRVGWLSGIVESMLLRGMGWGWVRSIDARGMPAQVEPLHPDLVEVRRVTRTGPVTYYLEGAEVERWPRGPLWGSPLYPPAGSPIGVSAITHGARQIGLGLAAQGHALDFFDKGAHPTGILRTDQQFRNEEDTTRAEELKERFKEAVAGRDIAVLGSGLDYTAVQLSAEDSQFLETIAANVPTICRLFDVRPERIGSGPQGGSGSITYANLEVRLLHHLTEAVAPVARALASWLSQWLPRGQFVRFDLRDQVVLDSMTEIKVLAEELQWAMSTYGEGRTRLGREPVDGIDVDATLWPPGPRSASVSVSLTGEDGADAQQIIDGRA